jgi:hypothetical protein
MVHVKAVVRFLGDGFMQDKHEYGQIHAKLVLQLVFVQEKEAETTKQKQGRRRNPKHKEQEGMPQHQHGIRCFRSEKYNVL